MKRTTTILILTGVIFFSSCSQKQNLNKLRAEIQEIDSRTNGIVGVAFKNLETNDTLSINNSVQFPMQSVYKFPLALAVLDKVDKGELTLNQKIHVSKKDLLPNTWSPLRERYPEGDVDLKLSEIIEYTVSQSDNNGCDIQFRILGGTSIVENYIHNLGITDISIKATEEEMHADWNVQFTNWCKPMTMVQILELFECKKILSDSSKAFLWRSMVETNTGINRIKGLLPKGTIVAHKTGTSGKNEEGISAAVNDVGIMVLPNGHRIAISIFVTNSRLDDVDNEKIIADIALKVYNYYQSHKSEGRN